MAICKECGKELGCAAYKEEEKICPECEKKIKEKAAKVDQHLEIKQKRFTSE